MTPEELKFQEAMRGITKVFADTSVSEQETKVVLQQVRDELDMMIDSLDK